MLELRLVADYSIQPSCQAVLDGDSDLVVLGVLTDKETVSFMIWSTSRISVSSPDFRLYSSRF